MRSRPLRWQQGSGARENPVQQLLTFGDIGQSLRIDEADEMFVECVADPLIGLRSKDGLVV